METLWQDIRYGLRMLAKHPGFTVVALLTLALGIGANTAIFSILDAVLLRPLPFPEHERLVAIWGADAKTGETHRAISYPNFTDLRDQSHALDSLAAFTDGSFTLTGAGEPLLLHGGIVSASLLSVLRTSPELGRGFSESDDAPGARVVLLSHKLWQSRFGGDTDIVGKSIMLQGKPFTVVGVMPAKFEFPFDSDPLDIWTSMAIEKVSDNGDKPMVEERGAHFLAAIGRLKHGVSVAQANAETAAISASLEKLYPDDNAHLALVLQPEVDAIVGDVRTSLLLLFGAVGFLLLIACANVANLLLARAASREREMAVRTALGAARSRLVRQLLTESVMLSLAGGIAGLLLAAWTTSFLSNMPSLQIPRLAQARLDWAALLFMAATSLLTGIAFGLAPSIHSFGLQLFSTLKEGSRSVAGNKIQNRIRAALVVAEVSLALILLVGASLLAESLVHLWRTPPGFDANNVLTFDVNLPEARYGKPQESIRFYENLLGRIRAVPGVTQASGIFPLPLSDSRIRTSFEIEGQPVAKGEQPRTHIRAIGVDYFHTMRIPLIAGREFDAHDDARARSVVMINETFAKRFFPGENPIGRRIKPDVSVSGTPPMREIVGVVGDVKHRNLWLPPDPECYAPYDQLPFGTMTLVVRAAGDPLPLAPIMREQVKELDAELPVYRERTMDAYVSDSIAQRRFTGIVCSTFAAVGLLLSIVGLYGVMSYIVEQRTHEIGIRVAVGAERRDVLGLIVGHGLRLALLGVALGTVGALALSRVIASELFQVTATDLRTYLAVAAALTGVSVAACYIPARRATRVDPIVALRYE
jgi:putative ABC transport system permease protein